MSAETLELLQNLLTLLIGILAAPTARALTALLKARLGTSGVTTQMVAGAMSALVAGGIGYATGAYGYTTDGIVRAVIATLIAMLTALGTQKAGEVAAARGQTARNAAGWPDAEGGN